MLLGGKLMVIQTVLFLALSTTIKLNIINRDNYIYINFRYNDHIRIMNVIIKI